MVPSDKHYESGCQLQMLQVTLRYSSAGPRGSELSELSELTVLADSRCCVECVFCAERWARSAWTLQKTSSWFLAASWRNGTHHTRCPWRNTSDGKTHEKHMKNNGKLQKHILFITFPSFPQTSSELSVEFLHCPLDLAIFFQVREVCSFYVRRLVRLLPAFWLAMAWTGSICRALCCYWTYWIILNWPMLSSFSVLVCSVRSLIFQLPSLRCIFLLQWSKTEACLKTRMSRMG